jgi:hypothetical protein
MLAVGDSFENVRNVAQLASDIKQGAVSFPVQITSTQSAPTPVRATQTSLPAETPVGQTNTTVATVVETPFLLVTSTPRPTQTPQPRPIKPFALVGQDAVCDTSFPEGLLQVMLMDSHRRQMAGIQIVVTWNGGEDGFYTGFKPEVGDGYADFQMEAGITYSVRVANSGTTVPNVSIPTCTDSNGQTYPGGLLLTFQQP